MEGYQEVNQTLYNVIRNMREECSDVQGDIWQEKVISRLFYCVKIKDNHKPSDFEEEIETYINEVK